MWATWKMSSSLNLPPGKNWRTRGRGRRGQPGMYLHEAKGQPRTFLPYGSLLLSATWL